MKLSNIKVEFSIFIFLVFILIMFTDLLLNIFWNVSVLNFSFNDSAELWAKRWQWGDVLSGHFSALAFMAVAYSIYLQRKDISQQREYENLKLNLQTLKDLDDRMDSIIKMSVSLTSTSYLVKNLVNIEEFSDEIMSNSTLNVNQCVERNKVRIELLYKFKYFYTAINTIKILCGTDTDQKYLDVLNTRLDHYKTIVSQLLRIFIFLHENSKENLRIYNKTTDSTYRILLNELFNIDSTKTLKEKHLILLEIVKKKHFKISND